MKKMIRAAWTSLMVVVMSWPLVAEAQTKPKRGPSAAQLAARDRQKQCSAEWKSAKAGGRLEKGARWPQFWSACNTRLKGGKA